MVEQWYAVNKETGEIFEHKGRYTFSFKGLETSIVNQRGTWKYKNKSTYDLSMECTNRADTLSQWEFKKVILT